MKRGKQAVVLSKHAVGKTSAHCTPVLDRGPLPVRTRRDTFPNLTTSDLADDRLSQSH